MKLFWILNVTLYTFINGFTFLKNSRYCPKIHNCVVLTQDDFPLNDEDDDIEQPIPSVKIDEKKKIFVFKKRLNSVYDGCDQRQSPNISDPDSLLYFYKKFREVLQKQEMLQKLQSGSYNDIEKLKIIEECSYLLENEYKPKIKPFYKGFEEFFDF